MDPPPRPPDAVAPPAGGDDDKGEEPSVHPPGGEPQDQEPARLPDDMLANVLGRLRPRWLAVSRRVCKVWRDAVDSRRLLRADLLPLSLHGGFVGFHSSPTVGDLGFVRPTDTPEGNSIEDHCNGLLLLRNFVFNPATRRWSPLPPHPLNQKRNQWGRLLHKQSLVYDPTVSPHYEVFVIPYSYQSLGDGKHCSMHASQWPPSPFKIQVFSSSSGSWEERSFVREGDAAEGSSCAASAVYWRGASYIHWTYSKFGNFVMRISLSDNKYHLIKLPTGLRHSRSHGDYDLVRSEKGVCFVSYCMVWLQVWLLKDSCGQTEWILKHDKDLMPLLAGRWRLDLAPGTGSLEDICYNLFASAGFPEDNTVLTVEEKSECSSDDDDDPDNADMVEECYSDKVRRVAAYKFAILGFHPFKEIMFFTESKEIVLAYHLKNSKVEFLGNVCQTPYEKFMYTPCWIQEFPL